MTSPDPTPLPPPPSKEDLDALLSPLRENERALALAEFDRVARRPAEPDLASYGCLGSFVGLVLLVALPNVARFLPVPRPVRLTLMVVAALLVIGGLLLRALVPAKRIRDAGQRAKRAIDTLVTLDFEADPAPWLREGSKALLDSFYSGGPWTVATFDVSGARKRLGTALPRFIALETLLRLERSIYPVFTEFTSPAKESDRTAGS